MNKFINCGQSYEKLVLFCMRKNMLLNIKCVSYTHLRLMQGVFNCF